MCTYIYTYIHICTCTLSHTHTLTPVNVVIWRAGLPWPHWSGDFAFRKGGPRDSGDAGEALPILMPS